MGFDMFLAGEGVEDDLNVHMFYATWYDIRAAVGEDVGDGSTWTHNEATQMLAAFKTLREKMLAKIRAESGDPDDAGESPGWSGSLSNMPDWVLDRYELGKVHGIIDLLEVAATKPEWTVEYG